MKTIIKNFLTLNLLLFISFSLFSCAKPGDFTVQKAMKSFSEQNFDKSIEFLNQALDEDLSYSKESVYTMMANVYLAQQDLENATLWLEKSLALKEDYRNYVTVGMNYHILGNDEAAELNYKKAVNLIPKKAEAYASLGSLYLGQEKYTLAQENLEKAAELEPKLAIIHANLALTYAYQKNFQKAQEEIEIAEANKCENLDKFKERLAEIKSSL